MTAEVIPFKEPPVTEPKCSFCSRPKSICKHMFQSGQGHNICDVCVKIAKERASK